jgi:hypothetical protein
MGRFRFLVAPLIAFLVLAGAQAAGANRIQTDTSDQAAAKRAVLRLADLPPIGDWQPELPSANGHGPAGTIRCKGYNPKTSDLVTTGQAKSEFFVPGLDIENEVTLLASPRMAELDWRRSIVDALLPCLATSFERSAQGQIKVVSLTRLPAPPVGSRSAAYRLVFALTIGGKPVRGLADFLELASGRAEVTFLLVAAIGSPAQQKRGEADMTLIDRRLAETVGGRILAPSA